MYSTGNNDSGQLGLGDKHSRADFSPVKFDLPVDSFFAGLDYSMLLSKGKLYIAGNNENSQLGIEIPNFESDYGWTFTTFTPSGAVADQHGDIVSIAGGNNHSFLVTSKGVLYGSGSDNKGQLGGAGTMLSEVKEEGVYTPIYVPVTDGPFHYNVKSVVAGNDCSILLTNSGEVYSAGNNNHGQLGFGDYKDNEGFTKISVKNVKSIALQWDHSLLLTEDGHIYATGNNNYGQLGLGDKENRDIFTQVPNAPTNVKSIVAGTYSSYLITKEGKVFVAGLNNRGQLGLGSFSASEYNTFTELKNVTTHVKHISAGIGYALLLTEDGNVFGVGLNNTGQLGIDHLYSFTQIPLPHTK
nr:hypothetical protein [Elizabethkingia anophelis]